MLGVVFPVIVVLSFAFIFPAILSRPASCSAKVESLTKNDPIQPFSANSVL